MRPHQINAASITKKFSNGMNIPRVSNTAATSLLLNASTSTGNIAPPQLQFDFFSVIIVKRVND
ncbi:MAG: hypothetical protein H6765_03450 [Candidatus Peribacteria bacterium]|nr:MAG: hypothetical protein H6765_03450 [Candidatus Peribacteria bacterium]